jgi:hypothetical protein
MRTALLLLVASASLAAQAPTTRLLAAPSTRASTIVNLAAPDSVPGVQPQIIRIDYGQPHLRGRTLHTGNLVPLDSVWRLGANASTELETGVDLVIGGQTLPKGKYSLHALPTAAGWRLIVNRNLGQLGQGYMPAHDVFRVDLQRRTLPMAIESLTISLVPATGPGTPRGDLRILWGTTELTTTWAVKS